LTTPKTDDDYLRSFNRAVKQGFAWTSISDVDPRKTNLRRKEKSVSRVAIDCPAPRKPARIEKKAKDAKISNECSMLEISLAPFLRFKDSTSESVKFFSAEMKIDEQK